MFLVVIDAHSKWPEVMDFNKNTKSCRLIQEFKKLFARHGLPLHIVTDNGRQFTSFEFKEFLKTNGINHSFSPPYHPATNGAAENFVGIFKNKVKKIVKGGEKLEDAINLFLLDYRSIKHCVTERSPSYLLYKRELRTRFDLLRPNINEVVSKNLRSQIIAKRGSRHVSLREGDVVMIDDYRRNTAKRVEGIIVKKLSPSTYSVQIEPGIIQKRHIDQIIVKCSADQTLRRSPRLAVKQGDHNM